MTPVKRVLAGGLGAPPGSPGAYTAIMSGVDNTTCVGIVELFAVP
jgi:hypothetical protein